MQGPGGSPGGARPDPPVRVLIATNRPAMPLLFAECARKRPLVLDLTVMPVDPVALLGRQNEVAHATVAVVDLAGDPWAGVELCQALRARRADRLVVAVLCCPTPATRLYVKALLAAGVSGLLDSRATPEDIWQAIEAVTSGETLHVRLHPEYEALVADLLPGQADGGARQPRWPGEADVPLLKLVARGLTNAQIAQRLHLSQYTVQHAVQRLCDETQTRGRTELAALAAYYGLYRPKTD